MKIVSTIAGIVLIFILISKLFSSSLGGIKNFIESTPGSLFVYFLIIVIFTVVEIVPLLPLTMMGGYFFGVVEGGIIGLFAFVVGSQILYELSLAFGHKSFVRKEHHLRIIKVIRKLLRKDAVYILFVGRILPLLPASFLTLASSMSRMSRNQFLVITIIGSMPQVFIEAAIGDAFAQPEITLGLVLFSAIASVILALYLLRVHPLIQQA